MPVGHTDPSKRYSDLLSFPHPWLHMLSPRVGFDMQNSNENKLKVLPLFALVPNVKSTCRGGITVQMDVIIATKEMRNVKEILLNN